MSAILSPEEEPLARVLFDEMERLDPTEEGDLGWDGLPEDRQDFYRFCVKAVLEARE